MFRIFSNLIAVSTAAYHGLVECASPDGSTRIGDQDRWLPINPHGVPGSDREVGRLTPTSGHR
ncbi:MAG: hypothetical protein AB7G11_13410 [Phycisphaerales bacterium]